MPLIDLAEAVSRGDIIVDEFDAVNAVSIGRLSDVKTARMSSIIAEHTMNLRSASNNTNNSNGNANAMATTSHDDSTWNGILVDEVELARAAEHNPHARSRLHMQNNERIRRGVDVQMRDADPESARQPDFEDSADENSRVWNSLLVDEIDIKHALQQHSANLSADDDRLNNNYRHYLNSNLNYESTSPPAPHAVVLLDDDSEVDDVEQETTSDADRQDESDEDVENNNCRE